MKHQLYHANGQPVQFFDDQNGAVTSLEEVWEVLECHAKIVRAFLEGHFVGEKVIQGSPHPFQGDGYWTVDGKVLGPQEIYHLWAESFTRAIVTCGIEIRTS